MFRVIIPARNAKRDQDGGRRRGAGGGAGARARAAARGARAAAPPHAAHAAARLPVHRAAEGTSALVIDCNIKFVFV